MIELSTSYSSEETEHVIALASGGHLAGSRKNGAFTTKRMVLIISIWRYSQRVYHRISHRIKILSSRGCAADFCEGEKSVVESKRVQSWFARDKQKKRILL